MKFGKLADISEVDFSLPPDPQGTSLVLEHLEERRGQPAVYIGATGWGMREWVGRWYPEKTPAKKYLAAYGRQFNTIELNTTHYRIPNIEMTTKWLQETPGDFRFCPKMPQTISHSTLLGMDTERPEIFLRETKKLGNRLGCCFMQMPPYFSPDQLHHLERFLSEWDADVPLAVEVRHPGWFERSEEGEQLFRLLEKYNISTVITDVAGRRDVLHNRLTTDTAMIRFVGNGLTPSDYGRMDAWAEKLKNWFDQNLRVAYFFPHQPDNILSPEAAAYLMDALRQRIPDVQVRGPKRIETQMSLF